MNSTREKGAFAEGVAEAFYVRAGYRPLARNVRFPYGEIDLVLLGPNQILFVEVKGRRTFRPDEAWSPHWRAKKRRLRRVAETFLARHAEYRDLEMVFEIVFVTQGRVSERFVGETFS